jgi:hypothetical protein
VPIAIGMQKHVPYLPFPTGINIPIKREISGPAGMRQATQPPHIAGPLGVTRGRTDNWNKKNSYL